MNAKWLMLIASLFGVLSLADVGTGLVENCGQGDTQFTMYTSAFPSRYQGCLTIEGRSIELDCVPSNKRHGSVNESVVCVEARNGEGKFLLSIEQGGITNLRTLIVKQEQIFPLPPQVVTMFECSKVVQD